VGFLDIAEGGHSHGTLTGVKVGDHSLGFATRAQKIWDICNALGNIAFAYSFSMILIEIQVCRTLPKLLYCIFYRPQRCACHQMEFHDFELFLKK
jgi:hypothetical protein